MSVVVVGIDGGGTKTVAAVLDCDNPDPGGAALGRSGPCNIAAMPVSDALANILAAAAEAQAPAGRVKGVVAATAGYSFADRREELAKGLAREFPAARVKVVPDYAAAFAGATGGAPGIVAIGGTGSVVYGENGAGQSHRAGGYGYAIDDSGSGYGVGRRAIAAVLQAADGTGPKTTLAERLAAELGCVSWDDLAPAIYGGAIDRARVASLAMAVAAAAREDGDEVARGILMRAGGSLAKLTEAVARTLFRSEEAFAVYPTGSLWEAGEDLTAVYFRSLARFAPHARRGEALYAPAIGAAIQACALLRGE